MFRKRKDGGDQGYDRISRLVEERQRELAEGADEGEDLEEDTIIMHAAGAQAPDEAGSEDRPVSLFNVRGAARPEPSSADADATVLAPQRGEPAAPAPAPDFTGVAAESEPAQPDLDFEPEPEHEEPARSSFAAAGWEMERTVLDRPPMAMPDLHRAGGDGTLVAANAVWEGKLRSEGDVRVEGVVQGEIDTTAMLVVAPAARVLGTIRARSVMIAGEVEGEVMCEERLEVLPGGSARGQINSGTLVVHEGAYIDSRFQMRREAEPR